MRVARERSAPEVLNRLCRYWESKGKESSTIQSYRSGVREFIDWLSEKDPERSWMDNLTKRQCTYYRSHLIRNFESATVNRKLAAIRSFLRWAVGEGMIKTPLPELKGLVLQPRQSNKGLAAEDAVKFRNAVEQHGDLRDKAMIALMLDLGLKADEICGILWKHVRTVESLGVIHIYAPLKQSKRWIVPRVISLDAKGAGLAIEPSEDNQSDRRSARWAKIAGELVPYIQAHQGDLEKDQPVFTREGRDMTRRALDLLVRRYARLAGVSATLRSLSQTYEMDSLTQQPKANAPQLAARPKTRRLAVRDPFYPDGSIGIANDSYQDLLIPDLLPSQTAGSFVSKFSNEVRDARIRNAVLIRSIGRCERCGFSSGNPALLEVHHLISMAEAHDTYNNCVALCPNCHRLAHILPACELIEAELMEFARTVPALPPPRVLRSDGS
jgi:integrase